MLDNHRYHSYLSQKSDLTQNQLNLQSNNTIPSTNHIPLLLGDLRYDNLNTFNTRTVGHYSEMYARRNLTRENEIAATRETWELPVTKSLSSNEPRVPIKGYLMKSGKDLIHEKAEEQKDWRIAYYNRHYDFHANNDCYLEHPFYKKYIERYDSMYTRHPKYYDSNQRYFPYTKKFWDLSYTKNVYKDDIDKKIQEKKASIEYYSRQPFSSVSPVDPEELREHHFYKRLEEEKIIRKHMEQPEKFGMKNVILPPDLRVDREEEFWFVMGECIECLRDVEAARKRLILLGELDVYLLFDMIDFSKNNQVSLMDLKKFFEKKGIVLGGDDRHKDERDWDTLFSYSKEIFFWPEWPLNLESFKFWILADNKTHYATTRTFNSWSMELEGGLRNQLICLLKSWLRQWNIRKLAKLRSVVCREFKSVDFSAFRDLLLNNQVVATTEEMRGLFLLLSRGEGIARTDIINNFLNC